MTISLGKLKNFVMRLETLDEEKARVMEDIRETLSEAKGEGFDTKILRKVLKIRKMKPEELSEEEELLHLYLKALDGGPHVPSHSPGYSSGHSPNYSTGHEDSSDF